MNRGPTDRGTLSSAKERLLDLLKLHAPLSTDELAQHAGVTAAAIRQHLGDLHSDGYVVYTENRGSVGRPQRQWSLADSDVVRAQFPDSHADLAVAFISAARDALGEDAVDAILAARRDAQLAAYRSRVTASTPLEEKLETLVEIRRAEGYMPEWSPLDDGGYAFAENNCPVCTAAKSCQGICDNEIDVFRNFFGADVTVEREEHIIAGDRRCSYEVRPR